MRKNQAMADNLILDEGFGGLTMAGHLQDGVGQRKFAVHTVSLSDLERHLNEMASGGWLLHGIHSNCLLADGVDVQMTFAVIWYKTYGNTTIPLGFQVI